MPHRNIFSHCSGKNRVPLLTQCLNNFFLYKGYCAYGFNVFWMGVTISLYMVPLLIVGIVLVSRYLLRDKD